MMMKIPLGFMGQVMGLVQHDWENERTHNFLMWQRTFNRLSLHAILYANPRREDYWLGGFTVLPPRTLTGFGRGIQFMLIFNH